MCSAAGSQADAADVAAAIHHALRPDARTGRHDPLTDTELDNVYTRLCKTMTRLGGAQRLAIPGPLRPAGHQPHRRWRGGAAARRLRRRRVAPRRTTDHGTLPWTSRALEYPSGFANEFATEALPGALPDRPQLAAARAVRPLRRAAVRHRVHRAARRQPALVALPDPPGAMHSRSSASTGAASSAASATSRRRPTSCAGTRCRCRRADRFRRRPGHDGRQRTARLRASTCTPPTAHGGPLFLQRGRRAADRSAAGRLRSPQSSACSASSRRRSLSIPRGVRFQVRLPDGAARGYVCENYGAQFRLPDSG